MAQSEQINELAAALVAAQAEMPAVAKGADNPFFKSKYADLASIVRTASPVLSKHGLAIAQFVGHDGEGRNTLVTHLLHTSGQYISDEMLLLLPKEDPQGQGSAITYARRYSYQAAVGLVADVDDDGNKATEAYKKPPAQSPFVSKDNAEALIEKCNQAGVVVAEVVKLGTNGRTTDPYEVFKSEVKAIKEAFDSLAPASAA